MNDTQKAGIQLEVADALKAQLRALADGANQDIADYAHSMSVDAVAAALSGNEEVLQSLERQALLLAEKHRIRIVGATAEAFSTVVSATVRAAVRVIAIAAA